MSANILVSNGTCYSSSGKKLDPAHFIPCGNAAYGHVTCCGVGDNCLAQNACFGYHGTGYGSALTYQVGCTDPSYSHSSCPDKKGIDQPWIALTLCDNSDGIWAPCPQEGSPSTLRPGSYCSCTDASKTTAAFDDNTVLANIASLPRTEGGSISFFGGHTPTTPPNTSPAETTGGGGGGQASTGAGGGGSGSNSGAPSQTGTRSGPSTTGPGTNTGPAATSGTITGTNTDTASSNNPSGQPNEDPQGASRGSSGLNSGAKIGIGIGAAVGGLILIGTLIALFYFSRKRRRMENQEMMENGEAPTGAGAGGIFGKKGHKQRFSDTSTIPSGVSEADGKPMSEADGKAVSKPWLGNRSELEGDNQESLRNQQAVANGGVGRNGHTLTPVAELPGSEPWPALGR